MYGRNTKRGFNREFIHFQYTSMFALFLSRIPRDGQATTGLGLASDPRVRDYYKVT